MVVSYNSAKVTKPAYGIVRRVLAHSDNIMLTEHIMERGAVLPDHQHVHEQLVYVIKGEIVVDMRGERIDMTTGDSLVIPSNANHKATALTKSIVLDVFTPSRQDYL